MVIPGPFSLCPRCDMPVDVSKKPFVFFCHACVCVVWPGVVQKIEKKTKDNKYYLDVTIFFKKN